MTSEIRANTLKNRVGLGTVSFTNTGPVVSGIVTATGIELTGSIGDDIARLKIPDGMNGAPFTGNLEFGNNRDFVVLHDGHHNYIKANNGNVYVTCGGNTLATLLTSGTVLLGRDLDVDGHTNLDNVNIVGVTTTNGNLNVNGVSYLYGSGGAAVVWGNTGYSGHLSFDGSNNAVIRAASGKALIFQTDHVNTRMTIGSQGNVSIEKDLDVDGHTNLDNVNIAGVTTASGNVNVSGITTSNTGFMFGTGGQHYLYQSASDTATLRITSDGPYVQFKDVSGDVQMGSASGDLRLSAGGNEKVRITSAGDVSISSDGTVHGVSKLTLLPADRTTAFSASDGDTWHDVVLKQTGSATNNAVGIAFETSTSGYHKNAGTGIAAVKNGTNSDYGADLVFITRPQSAVAEERLRIDSSGNIRQVKTGANVSLTLSRNESVGTTNQALGVIDFASNTAHTVQARVMAKSLGTSNVGGDLIIETRADGGSLDERVRFTGAGDVAIGRDAALANYAAGSTTTQLAVVKDGGAAGSGYHEVAHFTGGSDSNDTGAIVRITQFNNDRGLFIKGGRGTSDQAKALIGLRDSAANDTNFITITQNTDQIDIHKSVNFDNSINLSLGGVTGHAPLHVRSENTSYGKSAVFGASGWVNHANYHHTDSTITLLGRDLDGNDKGAGIEFCVRNTGDSNWNHGAINFGQDGFIRMFTGGAGTYVSTEKFTIDNQGNSKLGTSTPAAFTGGAPVHTQSFLGKKCMQGSVTSYAHTAANGTGVFDLGRLWLTDDSCTEIFLQIMRNDSANYNTHYCKAFIQKVRGTGMANGHILYQNGAHSGFSVSSIQAGGYTASGGASHGTEIHVTGGHGGIIYRMTCFYTTISKNDMY